MKFKEAYKEYVKFVEIKQKPQSVRCLKERFNKIIIPYFGDYNIHEINESVYVEFQNKLLKEDKSYNYLRNIHYLTVAFLDYCIKFLDLKKNVARNVGNFNPNCNSGSKSDFYTLKEFKKFIKKVDNNVYKQFFNLMFYTGTRPGEAMALKFKNINKRKIKIESTIDEHGERKIGTPKTRSSIREINIDRKLYKDIIKLKKYYMNKYKNFNDDYFIFGGIKPLAPTTIRRKIKEASTKAKVKYIKIHDFRHSHATLLSDKKIPLKLIQQRLGHANLSTTVNTYIHVNREQEKRVIKTLNLARFL